MGGEKCFKNDITQPSPELIIALSHSAPENESSDQALPHFDDPASHFPSIHLSSGFNPEIQPSIGLNPAGSSLLLHPSPFKPDTNPPKTTPSKPNESPTPSPYPNPCPSSHPAIHNFPIPPFSHRLPPHDRVPSPSPPPPTPLRPNR